MMGRLIRQLTGHGQREAKAHEWPPSSASCSSWRRKS